MDHVLPAQLSEKKPEVKKNMMPKLERPKIKNSLKDTEWRLFWSKWERYREASGL